MNYYQEIMHIIVTGILQEERMIIQQKMIELSKIHDVNAMKLLYLLIKMQPELAQNQAQRLITNLDYQDEEDKSTVCINLSNNTVKAAYRLLDTIIASFYISPNLKDENKSTVYGYLMAHLADIYRADNNFHSKVELEKVMVSISKLICMNYKINMTDTCYTDRFGNEKTYPELLEEYRIKNASYIDKDKKEKPRIKKILKDMKKREDVLIESSIETPIRNIDIYNHDERFTKIKRYDLSTYNFAKKYLK